MLNEEVCLYCYLDAVKETFSEAYDEAFREECLDYHRSCFIKDWSEGNLILCVSIPGSSLKPKFPIPEQPPERCKYVTEHVVSMPRQEATP